MGWFRREKKEVKENLNLSKIMIDYVLKARELGFTDELIRDKFKSKGYEDKLIDVAFLVCNQFKDLKGGKNKMAKKEEEEYNEEQESETEPDEEEQTEENEEEGLVKPKKVVKKPEVKGEQKEEVTISQVLQNFEQAIQILNQRVQIIESKLFRIQNS